MKKKVFLFIIVSVTINFWFLNSNCLAQPGFLDLTFDYDGKVITTIENSDAAGSSIAIQDDGKIVVAGVSDNGNNYDIILVRYDSNGTLDNTFGSDGIVTTSIGNSDDMGNSVAIQSDGKILVAGTYDNGFDNDVVLVKYNNNGSIDTTFDTDGIVTTAVGNFDDYGYSVAIQSDNKIVVSGYSYNGFDYDFALLRYNSNGSLDNTFGLNGIVTTDFGNSNNYCHSVAIQNDGKILASGWSNNGFALVRYNSNGSLDNTFDTDGIVTTVVGSSGANSLSIAIQGDSKIVLAGASSINYYWDLTLVRYNNNGSLDSTFDSDGIVTTDFGNSNDWGKSVAIQSDGKILVAGSSDVLSDYDFAIVRYNSNGSLDNTFGFFGIMTTDFGSSYDYGHSVAIQDDGKIVVAGVSDNGSVINLALARYTSGNLVVNEISNPVSLIIAPNPCNGVFQLGLTGLLPVSDVKIEVYDRIGKLVYYERQSQSINLINEQISLNNLPSGMYILNLILQDMTFRKKLIIQK